MSSSSLHLFIPLPHFLFRDISVSVGCCVTPWVFCGKVNVPNPMVNWFRFPPCLWSSVIPRHSPTHWLVFISTSCKATKREVSHQPISTKRWSFLAFSDKDFTNTNYKQNYVLVWFFFSQSVLPSTVQRYPPNHSTPLSPTNSQSSPKKDFKLCNLPHLPPNWAIKLSF